MKNTQLLNIEIGYNTNLKTLNRKCAINQVYILIKCQIFMEFYNLVF
jgi:hypothetical protein